MSKYLSAQVAHIFDPETGALVGHEDLYGREVLSAGSFSSGEALSAKLRRFASSALLSNPTTNPALAPEQIWSANQTLSTVAITGTAGQFSCAAPANALQVGQRIIFTGTYGGTGSITGYFPGNAYYIIATNGSTTFTLSASLGGPAITTTAGTPTGLTYTMGQWFTDEVVSSNGFLWKCYTAGAGGSVAPVASALAPNKQVADGAAVWLPFGPISVTAVATGAPNVSTAYTTAYSIYNIPSGLLLPLNAYTAFSSRGWSSGALAVGQLLTWMGGIAQAQLAANLQVSVAWTRQPPGLGSIIQSNPDGSGRAYAYTARIAFYTDSRKFGVAFNSSSQARIIVDGQFVHQSGELCTSGAATNQITTMLVDLTGAGATKMRKVVIETNYLHALFCTPGDTFVPLQRSEFIRSCQWYDSVGGYDSLPGANLAQQLGNLLGWEDNYISAVAGTGVVCPNLNNVTPPPVTGAYNYYQRMLYELPSQFNDFDVAVIWASFNDATTGGAYVPQVTANTLLCLQTIRANLPTAPIFVIGPIVSSALGVWGVGAPGAFLTQCENAYSDAVAQFNDPLCFFIPTSTDPAGSWFYGPGYAGGPTPLAITSSVSGSVLTVTAVTGTPIKTGMYLYPLIPQAEGEVYITSGGTGTGGTGTYNLSRNLGSGYTPTVLYGGSNDAYTGVDGVHPSPLGILAHARRAANAIRRILSSIN